ncbi:MAG: hypothetical protein JNJ46_33975 [Myxococcales bacterium]|nr:hypothetical protein [Myxococcales bacterium]
MTDHVYGVATSLESKVPVPGYISTASEFTAALAAGDIETKFRGFKQTGNFGQAQLSQRQWLCPAA